MHSIPHRNNSDFQLKYFLSGSCFTADGAWALMYAQKIDRETVIKACEVQKIRRKIKFLEINNILTDKNISEIDKLKAEADLLEWQSSEALFNLNYEAAKAELSAIIKIMDELEPHRKYSHLPVLEANEAAQRGEWLGEFKNRVENYLFTSGTIPEDQLRAMRNHPDFQSEILPHIKETMLKLSASKNSVDVITHHSEYFLEDKSNV